MKKWQSVSLLDAWLDFPFRFIPGKEFVTTHRFIYRQRRRCLYTNRNITYVKIIRITRVVDWVFKVFFEWIHFGGGDSNDINRDVEFLLNHINRSLREKVWKLDGAVLRDRPILFLTLFYSVSQWRLTRGGNDLKIMLMSNISSSFGISDLVWFGILIPKSLLALEIFFSWEFRQYFTSF